MMDLRASIQVWECLVSGISKFSSADLSSSIAVLCVVIAQLNQVWP